MKRGGSILVLVLCILALATQALMVAWRQTSYFCDTVATRDVFEKRLQEMARVHDAVIESISQGRGIVVEKPFRVFQQRVPQGLYVATQWYEKDTVAYSLRSLMTRVKGKKGKHGWLVSHHTFSIGP